METPVQVVPRFSDEDHHSFCLMGKTQGSEEYLIEVKDLCCNPNAVCIGTLSNLFTLQDKTMIIDKDGTTMKIQLWREDGNPALVLIDLMRSIVWLVLEFFDREGITRLNLEPDCLSIMSFRPYKLECALYPDLSEEFFRKAKELPSEDLTHSDHLIITLGRLLFFCITGGKNPFRVDFDSRPPEDLKSNPHRSAVEQIPFTMKNCEYYSVMERIPEAMDLILTLLKSDPNKRYDDDIHEIKDHPFFWDDGLKFRFLYEFCRRVNTKGGIMFESLVSVKSIALGDGSNQDDLEKLLKRIQDDGQEIYNHHPSFDEEREMILSRDYLNRYPFLFFEVFKVVVTHAKIFIKFFVFEDDFDIVNQDLPWDKDEYDEWKEKRKTIRLALG